MQKRTVKTSLEDWINDWVKCHVHSSFSCTLQHMYNKSNRQSEDWLKKREKKKRKKERKKWREEKRQGSAHQVLKTTTCYV